MTLTPQAGPVPLVSVIVTTRNSELTLDACLSSIRGQSHAALELIVVDNHSSDNTLSIANSYRAVVTTKGPERSAQRNYGAELAQGEILAFIDSDMILDSDVVAEAVDAFTDPSVRAVVIPEVSFGDGFWTRCRMLERECYLGDESVEAARMYRRSDFFDVGGFDLELNGGEDWDLSGRMARGPALARTASFIHHDEGHITLRSNFVKRRYYAASYLRYLRKGRGADFDQANPVLRSAYFRHWRTLVRRPVLTAGMLVLKFTEAAAVVQVAAEQAITRRTPDRSSQVYRHQPSGSQQNLRPLIITFGSVRDADGGVQTRARLTAETFTELGLPVSVLSTREPAAADLPPWASRLTVPAKKPVKGMSREFVRLIRSESADANLLVITNAMFMPAVVASRTGLPLVWDTNECQSLHYRRLSPTITNRVKYLTWFVLERWAARRCAVAIAIGSAEAQVWPEMHPQLRDKLAVVDHASVAEPRDPRSSKPLLEHMAGTQLAGPVLLFLGTLRAKHNAAAAKWITTDLAPNLSPGTVIVLCGPGSEAFQQPGGDGATVIGLGAVDDVDVVVAAADICLAPLASGAGVKTKVLHYLAHGKPVVGTPLAFEGLDGAPGLYMENLESTAARLELLRSEPEAPDVAERRSLAQREWLDEHHGRAHVAQQWRDVFACLSLN